MLLNWEKVGLAVLRKPILKTYKDRKRAGSNRNWTALFSKFAEKSSIRDPQKVSGSILHICQPTGPFTFSERQDQEFYVVQSVEKRSWVQVTEFNSEKYTQVLEHVVSPVNSTCSCWQNVANYAEIEGRRKRAQLQERLLKILTKHFHILEAL